MVNEAEFDANIALASKINQRIKEILNTPITLDSKDPLKAGLISPYAWECRRNPRFEIKTQPQELTGDRSELCNIIAETLRHYAANPTNQGNIDKLLTAYEFIGTSDRSGYNVADYVNVSKEKTDEFMDHLINLAKQNQELNRDYRHGLATNPQDLPSQRLNLNFQSRIFLTGEKGIGKTFYLNYLLDAYIKRLNEERVVWIRLDLTQSFIETGFETWWRWNICHILFRYIHQGKIGLDLGSGNEKLITRLQKYTDKFKGQQLELEYSRHLNGIPNQRTPQDIEDWLYFGLLDYLSLDKNVSFIFVIDGLDRLGLRDSDKKEFNLKQKGIRENILHTKTHPAVYLITMRWESYLSIDSLIYRQYPHREIGPTDSYRILKKKNDCLRKRKLYRPSMYPKLFEMDEGTYGHFLPVLMLTFIRFVGYSLSRTLMNKYDTSLKTAFEILGSIFGNNKRNQFEALATIVQHFFLELPSDILDPMIKSAMEREMQRLNGCFRTINRGDNALYSKYYMVLEALILRGDSIWRPHYIMKHKMIGGKLTVDASDKLGKPEPDFIFNVFRHFYMSGRSYRISLFAPIRVLQFLSAHDSMISTDLIIELVKLFDYPEEALAAILEELRDNGLVFQPKNVDQENYDERAIHEAGLYTLNKICRNMEYLSLALEDAPLPISLVNAEYFPISPIFHTNDYVLNNRIVATVNFIRLLREIERCELEMFDKRANDEQKKLYREKLPIVEDMAASVISSIENIVNDACSRTSHNLVLKNGIEERVLRQTKRFYDISPAARQV